MSKECEVCHKKPTTGNLVSHSNRKTKRRWLPNLQTTTLIINGVKRRIRLCTRCLRSHKTKAA